VETTTEKKGLKVWCIAKKSGKRESRKTRPRNALKFQGPTMHNLDLNGRNKKDAKKRGKKSTARKGLSL